MRVGIDIDGVLAKFDTPFADLLAEITGRPCQVDDPPCWEWPRLMGFTEAEENQAWRCISSDPSWWGKLEPYDDSFVDFHAFQNAGWDLYFITARRTPFVKGISEQWLRRHYRINNPTVITTSRKGLIAKALELDAHIDDAPKMVLDVKHKSGFTRTYLRTRLHNADSHDFLTKNHIILVDSVQAMFDQELERISK